jgi:probable HAF family extracellular repeat protein
MNKKLLSLCLLVAVSVISNPAAAEYSFSILPSLGGYNYYAWDINNSNQIVGYSHLADNTTYHAALWSEGNVQDLGTLGGGNSVAMAINDHGQISGSSQSAKNSANSAVLWNNNSIQNLGTFGADHAYAKDINDNGQVAVYSLFNRDAYGSTYFGYGYVYDTQTDTRLGLSTSTQSQIKAINNNGQVVGMSYNQNTYLTATSWQNGTATYLPTLDRSGPFSVAMDVNDNGQIVGESWDDSGVYAATWINGNLTKLASLSSSIMVLSTAYGINNAGQIIGKYNDFAALWMDDQLIDLNSYLSQEEKDAGWVLNRAIAINDKGSIIGGAHNNLTGTDSSFLLLAVTPVPEPETFGLLVFGLGLIRIATKRKNK